MSCESRCTAKFGETLTTIHETASVALSTRMMQKKLIKSGQKSRNVQGDESMSTGVWKVTWHHQRHPVMSSWCLRVDWDWHKKKNRLTIGWVEEQEEHGFRLQVILFKCMRHRSGFVSHSGHNGAVACRIQEGTKNSVATNTGASKKLK